MRWGICVFTIKYLQSVEVVVQLVHEKFNRKSEKIKIIRVQDGTLPCVGRRKYGWHCVVLLPSRNVGSAVEVHCPGGLWCVFVCSVICTAVFYHRSDKLKHIEQVEVTPREDVIDVTVEEGENGQPITTVTYPTQQNTYKFVNMGQRQSVEDKFEQIAKMDKTQFVIYCARLFGLNGYSVKLTPVLNNKSVDLVIEKSGETIAVGCINGNRLLSVADVKPVLTGSAFYRTNKCMVITNMYFDKEATYFAQSHNVALVDRTTIIKDYMM